LTHRSGITAGEGRNDSSPAFPDVLRTWCSDHESFLMYIICNHIIRRTFKHELHHEQAGF